jgi:proteasome lid subunit RPN8/RPN11
VIKLIFSGNNYTDLASQLLNSEVESCALILANQTEVSEGKLLLVSEIVIVPDDFYSIRTESLSEIKPDFLVAIVKRAREAHQSIIFCHTHPNCTNKPVFSHIDDKGEIKLATFLQERVPNITHVALIIGQNGCRARVLGSQHEIDVIQAGINREVISSIVEHSTLSDGYDRQVRAFGKEGQDSISKLKIGVVGLGGTGSFIANELAHLGINNYLLIDPDDVEVTNLNRLIGATPCDIDIPKVELAKRSISLINTNSNINAIKNDVTYSDVATQLTDCDFIFCCTDSHASRAVINQIAYQYYIPAIDMGVSISIKNGVVSHITGRVQMLTPSLGCLVCGNVLDGNAIRREMMNEEQIKADPYFNSNIGEPQPAVISLNGTISSLAVTMFLSSVTKIPGAARLQYYDGIKGVVRSATETKTVSCIVCSKNGALGLGSHLALPTKSNKS